MKKDITRLINTALTEDRAREDITSRILVPADKRGEAVIRTKEEAVVCGADIARQVFRRLDPSAMVAIKKRDGQRIRKNEIVLTVRGKLRSILSAERTALNFLGRLSGIATQTSRFVSKAPGTAILDTRKTTPGLRALEKYAVRCGGGKNHRMNLADMVMIKDNHRIARRGISEAVAAVRRRTSKPVIVEADTFAQFKEALEAGPDVILLDNMRPEQIRRAVAYKKKARKRTELEVSGNVSLKTVPALARARVDRISVGALTHSVRNIDFSLELKTGETMRKYFPVFLFSIFLLFPAQIPVHAQEGPTVNFGPAAGEEPEPPAEAAAVEAADLYEQAIFDDKLLIQGYTEKYYNEPLDILLAMIQDDVLNPLKMTAAIRVFREKYSEKVFNREKKVIERLLLRRYARSDSPFVQIEIMHAMIMMDRYKYFDSFIPHLVRKLDHYNSAVNDTAYDALDHIIKKGSNRSREARVIFNVLRKNLFLSRKRLAEVTIPGPRLSYKLKILRWSIKILGIQELKRLPPEVLNLL